MDGEFLFPALRQLTFGAAGDADSILPLFLSPSLQDVTLLGRPKSPNSLLLTSKIATTITRLDLHGYLEPVDANSATQLSPNNPFGSIKGYRFLRELRITSSRDKVTPVDSSSLHALLAGLPLLENFDLQSIYFTNALGSSREEWLKVCDHLKAFTLHYNGPLPTSSRLGIFAPCPVLEFVTVLHVFLPYTFLPQETEAFFLSLSASRKLHDATIALPYEVEANLSILLPLLSIQTLRTIRLTGGTLVYRTGPHTTQPAQETQLHARSRAYSKFRRP
jgi:hypothetical protein